MIIGHGIDIQEISAVTQVADRQAKFVDRILTSAEKVNYQQRRGKSQAQFLAGRFSAKEAYSKALGTGMALGLDWHDLEILADAQGRPYFSRHPRQATTTVSLSLSHTGNLVQSSVILEQNDMTGTTLQTPPVASHRPAWLEISAGAIAHNIQQLKQLSGTQRFCAVVKANAYGHGLAEIVPAAQAAGVDAFAVATMDEGIWLREFGVTLPILVLGLTPSTYAPELAAHALIPAVSELAWLAEAQANLTTGQQLAVSLPIDTGMGRIGLRTAAEIDAFLTGLADFDQLTLQSIWTHFATADTPDAAYFEQQLAQWHALTDELPLGPEVWRHISNSATSLWHQEALHQPDLIRGGAAMYGLDPSQWGMPDMPALQPALSLKADLVHVKQVLAGSSISYGATYTASADEWIGTLPIGYADGYRRDYQGMYGLLPDGARAEIVGRIAMDQMMVRLPKAYPLGTTIVLIGAVADERVTLEALADRAGTISYEVATSLATRLPRQLVD